MSVFGNNQFPAEFTSYCFLKIVIANAVSQRWRLRASFSKWEGVELPAIVYTVPWTSDTNAELISSDASCQLKLPK